ncbi:MAG: M4 family metallopeptidase [Saprospiraceae bacterium]
MRTILIFCLSFISSLAISYAQDSNPCGDQSSLFATLGQGESTSIINTFGMRLVHPNDELNEAFYEDPSSLLGGLTAEGHSLEYIRTNTDAFDDEKAFTFYEQEVHGIRVIGGGVTVIHARSADLPDGPNGPCDNLITFFNPNLIDNLSPSNPSEYSMADVDAAEILEISLLDIKSVSKVYRKPTTEDCTYRLVADINYSSISGSPRNAVIDLQNLSIIYDEDAADFKEAPTDTYGTVNLDDRDKGPNSTELVSSDGRVLTYNLGGTPTVKNLSISQFIPLFIPTSPINDGWDESHAHISVYQAHYAVTTTIGIFDGLGIEFEEVHVAANMAGGNAKAMRDSDLEKAYIGFGNDSDGDIYSLIDITGHELSHVYLYDYLSPFGSFGKSLHEGISDIFGTYIESVFQGGEVDWVIGDDNPALGFRDLQNPAHDCFTDVQHLVNDVHTRAEPLGHWAYLVASEGEGNIPLLEVVQLLMNALNTAPFNADYPDLMAATMDIALLQYGVCSPEFRTISDAWHQICVPTPYPDTDDESLCNFTISGPSNFCEESPRQTFRITNGVPNALYRFYIVGRQSTEYTSECGMQGNSQEGCDILSLLSIPDFPYYPQTIKIVAYNISHGPAYQEENIVTIYDCDGQDPTCEEYYNIQGLQAPSGNLYAQGITMQDVLDDHTLETKLDGEISVFNISGQQVFRGDLSSLRNQGGMLRPGVYIINSRSKHASRLQHSYKLFIYD